MLQLKGTAYDFINRFDKLDTLSFDIVYADKPLSCELRSYNMKDEYSRRVTISLNFAVTEKENEYFTKQHIEYISIEVDTELNSIRIKDIDFDRYKTKHEQMIEEFIIALYKNTEK